MTAIKRAHGDVIVMWSLKPFAKRGCVPFNLLINCSGTMIYGGRDVFKACLKCINTFSTIVKDLGVVYVQLPDCKLRSLCCVSLFFCLYDFTESKFKTGYRDNLVNYLATRLCACFLRDLISVFWCTNCDRIRHLPVTQKQMVQRNRPQQTS